MLDKPELARAGFEEARIILERELEKQPEDYWLHRALGIAYAGRSRHRWPVLTGRP